MGVVVAGISIGLYLLTGNLWISIGLPVACMAAYMAFCWSVILISRFCGSDRARDPNDIRGVIRRNRGG